MNGTRCRFLSACPPCVKGGRGDWAMGTKMMAQSNAERYNVIVQIRIGFQIIELPTAQSLRPSVRTGAPPFTQGRHEALPRQCYKLQFACAANVNSSAYGIFAHKKQAADLENPALNRLFLQKRPQIFEIIPGDNPLPTAGRVCPPAPDRGSIIQFWAKVYYYFLEARKTGEIRWKCS